MMFAQVKNKTVFCLLIITFLTTFFFARSVVVRERWLVPTFTQAHYSSVTPAWQSRGTSYVLITVNNWLQESPVNLGFGRYYYPPSVETPSLDKRYFYGSYPPGAIIPIYLMFKFLDATGIVPDIYEKRGTQLLLVTLYKYLLHFLTTLLLCAIVFVVCRRLNFDYLNSTLLAIVPAIVQFHNASTLYWNHFLYVELTAILLPFVLCILLEVMRFTCVSPKGQLFVRIVQPLVMFLGVFTDWFFVFVVLTIYIMRVRRKEIALPTSLQYVVQWTKQSFLFFTPAMFAVVLWVCQIAYYSQYVAPQYSLLDTPLSATFRLDVITNLLFKIGLVTFEGEIVNIWDYLSYHKELLFVLVSNDYGVSGLLIIYLTLYLAIQCRRLKAINIATSTYFMCIIPCLGHHIFFVRGFFDHVYSSLVFSPALSVSFAFALIFILHIMKKSHLIPTMRSLNKRTITVAAFTGLISSALFGYTQIYSKLPVTKMFTPSDYVIKAVGDFVRVNTNYYDVVFSQDYCFREGDGFTFYTVFFSDKVIKCVSNLDHIYHKTKTIEQDFTVRILYYEYRRQEMQQLAVFLRAQSISVEDIEEERVGGLLGFDGKEFIAWYEGSEKAANKPAQHECNTHPQRCEEKG